MSGPITTHEVEVNYLFRITDPYGREMETHEYTNEQDAISHLEKEYEYMHSEEFRQGMAFVLEDPNYVYDNSRGFAVLKVTTTTTTEVIATA